MLTSKLMGIRDPYGIRPLVLGKLGIPMASSTHCFRYYWSWYIREIENGEIVIIDKNGIESIKPFLKSMQDLAYLSIFISQDQTVF